MCKQIMYLYASPPECHDHGKFCKIILQEIVPQNFLFSANCTFLKILTLEQFFPCFIYFQNKLFELFLLKLNHSCVQLY